MSATPDQPRQTADGGRLDPRGLARAKREAMALRARRIRRWVAGTAVTLFVVAFLVIYVQLASGHDPALTANAERRASATKAGAASMTAAEREKARREREEAGALGEESSGSESTEVEGSSSGESESETSAESGTSAESTESGTSESGESEEGGPSSLRTSQS